MWQPFLYQLATMPTKQGYIDRVMLIMNEAVQNNAEMSMYIGANTAQIEQHIEGTHVDAWRQVAKVAPRTWLKNKSFRYTSGIIDTFVIGDVHNESKGGGFKANDICYFKVGLSLAAIKVLTVGANGQVLSALLVSGGSGFEVGKFYTVHETTGTGTEGEEGSYLGITVTAVKTINYEPIAELNEGIGIVVLPVDFYLLTKFKMEGWKMAVEEATVSDTASSRRQANEWTRGTALRPVVLIDSKEMHGQIVQVLRYYSLAKGLLPHMVEEAIYIPLISEITSLAPTAVLDISEQLYLPLAYLNASIVFTILEKATIASSLENMAMSMLPGQTTNKSIKQ